MKNVPFIGVCDVANQSQVTVLKDALRRTGLSYYHLGVGAMMSYKTLRGLDTKWAGIYPTPEALQALFVREDRVFNKLHYADYEGVTTLEDLVDAVMLAGGELDGIQFDMVWPATELLKEFRQTVGKNLKFIIQVSKRAVTEMRNRPSLVAQRLKEYYDSKCIDYVLFDMSGDTGMPMDASALLPYIGTTIGLMPDLSVVLAGGLGPDTMEPARPLVLELAEHGHDASFCAQSRLRPSGSAMDPLDLDYAERYVCEAGKLILECE